MNVIIGAVARHKGDIDIAVSGYYDIFSTIHESDNGFFDSFLTSPVMQRQYDKVSTGSLVEKQRVHLSQFMAFNFPLPPLEERGAISEILATADREIELLTQELEQQKLIKKYLMQQLLTGKKRVKEVSA
jgi:type I restriction enzyme S subunit